MAMVQSILLSLVDIADADVVALRSFASTNATIEDGDANRSLWTAQKLASSLLATLAAPISRAPHMAVLLSLEGKLFINHQTCYLGTEGDWREVRANWTILLALAVVLLGVGVFKAVLPALIKVPMKAAA